MARKTKRHDEVTGIVLGEEGIEAALNSQHEQGYTLCIEKTDFREPKEDWWFEREVVMASDDDTASQGMMIDGKQVQGAVIRGVPANGSEIKWNC